MEKMKTFRWSKFLVAGPTDVGKSTLCRILCNYAIREGRTLQYVDLDVGQVFHRITYLNQQILYVIFQGSISIPGTIASLYIEKPADIIDGFDRKAAYIFNVVCLFLL